MMSWSSDWAGPLPADENVPAPAPWTLDEMSVDAAASGATDARSPLVEADGPAAGEAEIQTAYERGLREGREQGARAAQSRIDSALAAVDKAVMALRSAQSPWTQDARENLSALAVAVARHIVGRELRGDTHVVADLVRKALTLFPVTEPVRVRLCPQDLSTLSVATSADGGSVRVAPGRELEWAADPGLAPGDCVVEGQRRVVDGRIDHALERIFRSLADD